jgi:hypothetical protein
MRINILFFFKETPNSAILLFCRLFCYLSFLLKSTEKCLYVLKKILANNSKHYLHKEWRIKGRAHFLLVKRFIEKYEHVCLCNKSIFLFVCFFFLQTFPNIRYTKCSGDVKKRNGIRAKLFSSKQLAHVCT